MGKDNSTNAGNDNGSLLCQEFKEIVQLILDGEARPHHKKSFQDYYMKCKHCVSYYDLESATHRFVRHNIHTSRKSVPDDLYSEIMSKINYVR